MKKYSIIIALLLIVIGGESCQSTARQNPKYYPFFPTWLGIRFKSRIQYRWYLPPYLYLKKYVK